MIFNKNKTFLYGSILLLILVGVYFTTVVESIGYAHRNPLYTFMNATLERNNGLTGSNTPGACSAVSGRSDDCNASYGDLANWTRGGSTEVFVFVINISNGTTRSGGISSIDNNNITRINITLPSGFGSLQRQADTNGLANASFFGWRINGFGGDNWTINTTGTYITISNTTNNSWNGIMGPRGVYETIYFSFNATAVNGTEAVYNWTITLYNSTGGSETLATLDSGLGLLTGIDGLPPRSNGTNVTDGENTASTFTGGTKYFKLDQGASSNGQRGVNITLNLNDFNADRVLLVYNSTGGSINIGAVRNLLYNSTFLSNPGAIPGTFTNFSVLINNGSNFHPGGVTGFTTSLGSRSDVSGGSSATAPAYVYTFNISNNTWALGAADNTLFKYVFVVYDLYNNSEVINNSNAEFVLGRDANAPAPTLTAPSDTSIGLFDSIKYTCGGSDTSGLASCTTKLTKPGSDTVTKTGCNTEHTFITSDTNEAGTYTVECSIKDNVQRTASTSKTFSVSASSGTGSGGSSGGGGGGGGSAGSSADNPVVVDAGESIDAGVLSTTETFTSVVKDGTVTFTVAGSSHSAKVLDVTTDSVTIEISSTPKQLTLTVSETKDVDVDDDGDNDLSVTLRAITDGKADLVFKSLEITAPPSEQPGTGGEQGEVIGEEAKSSTTWLWVLLIVVVLGLIIWYLSKKK